MRIPAPHVIEQIRQEREQRDHRDHRAPLHIPTPPPGWEPERRQRDSEPEPDRGVYIFQM